jgi:signal transduction histidine kinase
MTHLSHARLAPRSWLRLPHRTARLRLTALYGGLFLLSGVALVAGTYLLFERATAFRTPQLPTVPHAPAIQPLKLPQLSFKQPQLLLRPPAPNAKAEFPQALSNLIQAQHQYAKDQHRLALAFGGPGRPLSPLLLSSQLRRDRRLLSGDQQRVAQTVRQLAQAVHQVSQAGSVQAAQRASDSHQLLVDSGIALGVVGVLALLTGWLVAGRMLRPIRTITRTARRISSTSLHERLALDGPEDELKELGDTLDDLFARLEAAFEAQRRFVAHASHELRTPLTRERALVQVALGDPSTPEVWRSTGRKLLASNREQETLIDALLTLATSEGGLDDREPADLSLIVESVLRNRGDGDRLGLDIDAMLAAAPLDGDARLLESLVANLVDNAIRHNLEGGHVDVSTSSKDGKAVLTVTNTGPIIPPSEIDRLFQPFQRLDPRRIRHGNGHGLGLSIVRAIATAHGATVSAQPSPQGGVSIEIAFPPPPVTRGRGVSRDPAVTVQAQHGRSANVRDAVRPDAVEPRAT